MSQNRTGSSTEQGVSPGESTRRELYDIVADEELSLADKRREVLALGRSYFGVENAHVARIDPATDTHEVVASVGGPSEMLPVGATMDHATTYCRRTVEAPSPVALSNAPEQGWGDDPAYDEHGLACYLGAPVFVRGELYGTVCFVDRSAREASFSAGEKAFVELIARLLCRELEADRYEADLSAARGRHESLLETLPDAVLLVDTETERIENANGAAASLTGYDRGALAGMAVTELYPAADRDQVRALFEAHPDRGVTRTTLPDGRKLRLRTATGETVPVELRATTVELGDRRYVQAVVRDITERRERQQDLRLRTRAMEATDVGVTIVDAVSPDMPLVYVNDAFTELTGYDESAILGRNCRFLQGADTDESSVEAVREAIENGETRTTELLNYRADGTPFWNELTVTPVTDETGRRTHFVGIQRDVTERKRRQRLIEVLNRLLRHNLRNDMTVVAGLGEAIAEETEGPVSDRAETIVETVEDLVTVSEKTQEVREAMEDDGPPGRRDVAALVESTVAELRERHPEATVVCETPAEQHAVAGPRLRTVIEELVDNAVAAAEGSPTVTVAVDPPSDPADRVRVEVRDDGSGLPAAEARVLRKGSENALDHSDSFGLWLVNWLVTGMGGQVEASVDDGTTISIALQRARDGDRAGPVRSALGSDPASTGW